MPDSPPPTFPEPPRPGVRAGLVDSLGSGIGIFPLGVALGVLVIQAGLPWWLTPALSIGIFAGSVELLLVSMLAAATPILTIAVTVFAVNFRHVFYALSFPIDAVRRGLPRAYSVYGMVDEAYATYVLMPREQLASRRMVAGQLAMQGYWVFGGLIGVMIAHLMPEPIEGFEFALCALFTVMALDAVRSKRELPSALLAALAVSAALIISPDSALLVGLIIFSTLLALRFVLNRWQEARGTDTNTDSSTDASTDNTSSDGGPA
ncbi:AzlC family ABC transporter permease [Leucobacter sp. GX24907]